MRRFASFAAAALLPAVLLACSGNVVVEPADQVGKRAKAFIAKCAAPPPADGTVVKNIYVCLPPEDTCPAPTDPAAVTELGYLVNKKADCGYSQKIFDVPCGPDLNAVECCYDVRVTTGVAGGCN